MMPDLPDPPVHKKIPRKKRTPPAAGKPARNKVAGILIKKKRKKHTVIKPGPVAQVAHALERARTRRMKAIIGERIEPRYTLSEALAIGGALQPEDLKLFGQIEHDLRAMSKEARTRILAAVGRVFA